MAGSLIISLDFELHWGGAEVWDINKQSQRFLNTRDAILKMLQIFQEYKVRVTWATVGFLFAESHEEVLKFFPESQPSYHNQHLNYYNLFKSKEVGQDEGTDPYHYANSIIKEILKVEGQELASHTFSHYYCNEAGQTEEQFDLDLQATQHICENKFQLKMKSLVFPRNQYNSSYIDSVKNNDYSVIRVNPEVWFWKLNGRMISFARAFDTLFPISKRLTFKQADLVYKKEVLLLPASRFFRPYSKKERGIQKLKMSRIKKEMLSAAKRGEHYHLWWHPHNFGDYPKENLLQLREILEYFKFLRATYGFSSKNMGDFSRDL